MYVGHQPWGAEAGEKWAAACLWHQRLGVENRLGENAQKLAK